MIQVADVTRAADWGVMQVNDEQLFRDAYRRHHPPVLAYLRRRADDDQARELADEVFLIAWRRRTQAPTADLPLLVATARLLLQNSRRTGARNSALEQECAQLARRSAEPDPSDAVLERLAVLSALASLSTPDREVLMLVAWDGLDHRRTAEVLGITAATTAVRLFRARRRLAAALAVVDETAHAPDTARSPGSLSSDGTP